jgi:hypothetical protein
MPEKKRIQKPFLLVTRDFFEKTVFGIIFFGALLLKYSFSSEISIKFWLFYTYFEMQKNLLYERIFAIF